MHTDERLVPDLLQFLLNWFPGISIFAEFKKFWKQHHKVETQWLQRMFLKEKHHRRQRKGLKGLFTTEKYVPSFAMLHIKGNSQLNNEI